MFFFSKVHYAYVHAEEDVVYRVENALSDHFKKQPDLHRDVNNFFDVRCKICMRLFANSQKRDAHESRVCLTKAITLSNYYGSPLQLEQEMENDFSLASKNRMENEFLVQQASALLKKHNSDEAFFEANQESQQNEGAGSHDQARCNNLAAYIIEQTLDLVTKSKEEEEQEETGTKEYTASSVKSKKHHSVSDNDDISEVTPGLLGLSHHKKPKKSSKVKDFVLDEAEEDDGREEEEEDNNSDDEQVQQRRITSKKKESRPSSPSTSPRQRNTPKTTLDLKNMSNADIQNLLQQLARQTPADSRRKKHKHSKHTRVSRSRISSKRKKHRRASSTSSSSSSTSPADDSGETDSAKESRSPSPKHRKNRSK